MAQFHVTVNTTPIKWDTYAQAVLCYEICRRAGAHVALATHTELIRRYWPRAERRGHLGQMPAVQT